MNRACIKRGTSCGTKQSEEMMEFNPQKKAFNTEFKHGFSTPGQGF